MCKSPEKNNRKMQPPQETHGQALAEYALILALGVIGLVAVLTILAPAVGNVFSNTVYNLLGQTTTPQEPLSANEFWDVVTAVASYTPEAPDLVTNTPLPDTPLPTNTTEASPTSDIPTLIPSDTPIPSPTNTPPDTDFDYPFVDEAEDEDKFYDETPDLFESAGPWDGEFWEAWWDAEGNYCDGGDFFNAGTGEIPNAPEGTYQVDKIDFPNPDALNDYWQSATDKPHPDVGTDFCARFTLSMPLDAGTYTLRYNKDESDGVRIYIIDDATSNVERVVDDWDWSEQQDRLVDWTNTSTGSKTIRIVFRDTYDRQELEVSFFPGGTGSSTNCNWQLDDDEYYSLPTAWHDSVGGNYGSNLYCVLRLRGTIDMTGASEPGLIFMDMYDLANDDKAIVGISVAGTGDWADYTLHDGFTQNMTWERQILDLANFVDDDGNVYDFRNQIIEVRFVLKTDNSNQADGWWIDDITVTENPERAFYIGFRDDVEGDIFWRTSGYWDRTTEAKRSGSSSWSDYPYQEYENNSDTTLTLDGYLDLSASSPVPIEDPEVVFWHAFELDYNDRIYIEASLDKTNWTAMATRNAYGSNAEGSYIHEGNMEDYSFSQVVAQIPSVMIGEQRVYIRFRLQADNNDRDDGWWIDDIEFRNSPDQTITAPFCDNFESGIIFWTPSGDWAVTNNNPWRGSSVLEDSPSGNYSNGSNYSVELIPYIDLSTPGLTRPVLEFYHRWDIIDAGTSGDHLIVEISTNDGNSWITLFDYEDNQGHPYYGSSIMPNPDYYDESYAYVREVIELSSYIGFPVDPTVVPGLRLRFRLDATQNNTTGPGWYIDDFCLKDLVPPVVAVPFADDMEAGESNWIPSSVWDSTTEYAFSGSRAWSDSPYDSTYNRDRFHVLELRPTVDLSGTTNPVAYFWARHDLGDQAFFELEFIRTDANGQRLTDWEVLNTSYIGQNSENRAWVRYAVDLTPYVGQYLRFRFQLNGLYSGGSSADGVYVDDFRIVERADESVYPLDYFEDAEVIGFGEWVFGNKWDTVNVYRNFGSGSGLGPGQWETTWYDNVDNRCSSSAVFAPVDPPVVTMEDEINFDWDGGRPSGVGIDSNDGFGVSFRRTIIFAEDTAIDFTGVMDNGMRILVDGSVIRDYNWGNCAGRKDLSSFSYPPYLFSAGIYDIEVQFYEHAGDAEITVDFSAESEVFHDSPSGNYDNITESILELEGMIDLAGTTNPVLLFDQSYEIHSSDDAYIDISTDGGFTWDLGVYSVNGDTDFNWTTDMVDLSAYAGQVINIRFRLEALGSSNNGDGWWIDNIRIIE